MSHFLNELPILDQDIVQMIVAILTCAWLLLLGSLIAAKGSPAKRYTATCALAVISLSVIVFVAQQTRRRAGPYQRDDEEITTPAPYHVRVNDREQV